MVLIGIVGVNPSKILLVFSVGGSLHSSSFKHHAHPDGLKSPKKIIFTEF
jgi:hypothetical protein